MGIAAGAVSQDEAILVERFRDVKESADRGINGGVGEFAEGVGQGLILNPGPRRAW